MGSRESTKTSLSLLQAQINQHDMHMRSSPDGENAEQTQGLIGEKSIAIQYEESTPLNEELFFQQVPVLLTKNPLISSSHEIKKTVQETSTLTFN